jgi:hypothetical protein
VLLPEDTVLLEGAGTFPAIAVFRLPNGNTHSGNIRGCPEIR